MVSKKNQNPNNPNKQTNEWEIQILRVLAGFLLAKVRDYIPQVSKKVKGLDGLVNLSDYTDPIET